MRDLISKAGDRRPPTLIAALAALGLAPLLPAAALALGATWYVDDVDCPDPASHAGSAADPWCSFAHAVQSMGSGDTLVVKSGVYVDVNNRLGDLPNGTDGAYTVLRAETDFGVTIDGALDVNDNATWTTGSIIGLRDAEYVMVRGINVRHSGDGQSGAGLTATDSHHVKFVNCSAKEIRGAGHSIGFTNCSYGLVEGCHAWGSGRYQIGVSSTGDSHHIVFRRNVCRFDYLYTDEPSGSFSAYHQRDIVFQNNVAVDGGGNFHPDLDESSSIYQNGERFNRGFFTPNGHTDVWFYGNIVLNFDGYGLMTEGSTDHHRGVWVNNVAWDIHQDSPLTQSSGAFRYNDDGQAILDRFTIGQTNAQVIARQYGFEGNSPLTNSVFYDCQSIDLNPALRNFLSPDNDCNVMYGNGSNYNPSTVIGPNDYCEENGSAIDPITGTPGNGTPALRHILRVEAGSDLSGTACDGGDRGATILKRRGAPGTLYGDPGWNDLTEVDLWPWENEQIIHDHFMSYDLNGVSGERGFAVPGMTLTRYVWEYLGNPCPIEICNQLPVVTGVVVSPDEVLQGETITLTALGVDDPDGTVTEVQFWWDADGDGNLDSNLDRFLGLGSELPGPIVPGERVPADWEWSGTTELVHFGEQRFFARAVDDIGEFGLAASGTGTIGAPPLITVPGPLYPDIATAVDLAVDDLVIELTDASYTGPGNTGIDFQGKRITLRSAGGDPAGCVVDCAGADRAFVFQGGETAETLIEGITVTGGAAAAGGAVFVDGASPSFVDCVFADGAVTGEGGAVYVEDGAPSFTGCALVGNAADPGLARLAARGGKPARAGRSGDRQGTGAAVYAGAGAAISLTGCTIADNAGAGGGAIQAEAGGSVLLDRCIVAFNLGGPAAACATGGTIDLDCSLVYGNAGGDYTDCLAGQAAEDSNLAVDPRFCDAAGGDLRLHPESPCLAANNADCGLIGAFDLGSGCGDQPDTPPAGGDIADADAWMLYPNPAGESCNLHHPSVPAGSDVRVWVYDLEGQLAFTAVERQAAGPEFTMELDCRGLAPAIYFCRAQVWSGGETVDFTKPLVVRR